jgi:hypothetical protein
MSRAAFAREWLFSKKRRPLLPICLLIICLGFSPHAIWAHRGLSWQIPGLEVRLDSAVQSVAPGHSFAVNVMVDGAVDLGAFQFEVIYDPAVVTVTQIELEPFLESTGRTAQSIGPDIDNGAGEAAFGAFSFGAAAGPEGTGGLATVTFTVVGSGTTALNLQDVLLTDTKANAQYPSVKGGTVTVAAPAPTPTPTAALPSPTAPPTAMPTPASTPTATAGTEPAATVTPPETVTATATSETVVTPTIPPVDTETPTPAAAATALPVDTETPTPAAGAVPTPIALSTSTPAATPQPEAMVTPTSSPTPVAVLSRVPTLVLQPSAPRATLTAEKWPSALPEPSFSLTAVSFSPLCWLEMFLLIVVGCLFYELWRRRRK